MRGLNEETFARSEETEINLDGLTGRDGAFRSQVQNAENQQERNSGENSKRSKHFNIGTSIAGGMLDQLIGQFSDQLAEQQSVIVQAQENIEKLNRRIQECKELKEELEKQLEDES